MFSGPEISISLLLTLIGSGGPTLSLPERRPMKVAQTFFLVQFVVREYLLVGETGARSGELVW
jgi:hypothetical protein